MALTLECPVEDASSLLMHCKQIPLRLRAQNYSNVESGMNLVLEGDPTAHGCTQWVNNAAGLWYIEVSPTAEEPQNGKNVYTFIVEVLNGMSRPTDVHWHGMLPPNGQDAVGYLTEHPIMPNQTREYQFEQTSTSGVYWAHAHYQFQDAQGLAVPIVLKDLPQQMAAIGNPIDVIMMVEDRFRYNYCAYSPFLYPEHCAAVPTERHREVVHMLNRQVHSVKVQVTAGRHVRLRAVNVGSEAPWIIDVSSLGHAEVLALDGIELSRNHLSVQNKTISTAQRVDLLVKIPEDATLSCFPILAISLSHRKTLRNPPVRAILLSTGGHCPEIQPTFNGTLAPPVAWGFDHAAKAKYPMSRRPVDISYTLQIGGDQYGGFFFNCPAGLPKAACRDFKWGLPPYPVFKHNVSGMGVHTRRPCPGCEHLQGFNDSGLISINRTTRCWEWSDISKADCPNFKQSIVSRVNIQEDVAKMRDQALEVCSGQRVEIVMINAYDIEPNEGHPMHLHGHSFEVRRVERLTNGHWEVVTTGDAMPHDTVHVPWGFKVIIEFDAINSGIWLLHCHNTFHLENGMMTLVVYREDSHPRCRKLPQWTGNSGGL